jgi:hypothetical protein
MHGEGEWAVIDYSFPCIYQQRCKEQLRMHYKFNNGCLPIGSWDQGAQFSGRINIWF